MNLKNKVFDTVSKVKTYWKTPMKGRYMTFREIAAYSGGGLGAYMVITLGTACILSTGNTLISSTLGVDAMDMYVLYVIAVLANIPMTGIRANIIDNTRNKAGKYKPYILSMAIPTVILCLIMVWFPYNKLSVWLPEGEFFDESYAYVAKCAIILVLNLFIHFFYYFFYDGYENLIHVLSPNTQERADVSSIKSIVYSFSPTVINLITPILASSIFHTNMTDIRVYRLLYPIIGLIGILCCIIVYKNTEEKIVQARTHVIRIRFADAMREVAKNKYFWIISLAGWLGFLELSYNNILNWLYNYGGATSGTGMGIINTIYGNASLWGMLLAPFCIRKWGKKAVLIVTNIFNIFFILLMLVCTREINGATIWLVLGCLYMNMFMSSFAHILTPSIQADIRDYQQYKSGERIDGMFSAVGTIGTVITLATSAVLPAIYKKGGITKENAAIVTSNPKILNRVLGDGETVGQILAQQLEKGQDNYNNAYSALYDPDILLPLLHVLIIVSAVGALMNVIPYFWYDFNERKQKSVVRVLKIRAMFEDYGNGVLRDSELVETIDIIEDARRMSVEEPKKLDKKTYKSISDKQKRKAAKKKYAEDTIFNEEIAISQFVCNELDKFSNPMYEQQIKNWRTVYDEGLEGLLNLDMPSIKAEIAKAKAMPKSTSDQKKLRSALIEDAKKKKYAVKAIRKYFVCGDNFVKPDYAVLDGYYREEDECDEKLKILYKDLSLARKNKELNSFKVLKAEISEYKARKKEFHQKAEKELDKISIFARAAKPYLDAEISLKQMENYERFDEIASMYTQAKMRAEKAAAEAEEMKLKLREEEKAYEAKIKAEKKSKQSSKR